MITERALSGPFHHLRNHFAVLRASEGRGVPATALLDGTFTDRWLAHFRQDFPGADPRALVSYWTLWYFHRLVVPSTVVTLSLDRMLALGLDDLCLVVDESASGLPGIRLAHAGVPARGESPFITFRSLVRDHLEPMIHAWAARYRIAPRTLWGNAAHYLEWTLGQLEKRDSCARNARSARVLLDAPCWPDGWTNPMAGAIRFVLEGESRVRRRRVCCMRHRINSVEGCGALCPLPCARSVGS